MGKFINEESAYRGKVGNTVGSSNNGKPYVKRAPKKRTKKAKGGEKQNHSKFRESHIWLQPILEFVREGFKGFTYKDDSQGFSAAKSYLLTHAFEGIKPNLTINPALVKVSYGSLPLASNVKVIKSGAHELKFTWENSWTKDMGSSDQVMLLAYNIKDGYAAKKLLGQFRQTGEDVLKVEYPEGTNDGSTNGGTFHCYFALVAGDRSKQSDSIYLGEITF